MPSTGVYVCWFEPESSQLRDFIAWFHDAELASRVSTVLNREFGDLDGVKFSVIESHALGQSDQWVIADNLIDALRRAVEAREEYSYDNTPVAPGDFSSKQPERYFVAARDTARRITEDRARTTPHDSTSKSPIFIDDSGTLFVNKALPLHDLLKLLCGKVHLFLVRLNASEQAPNGDYILTDRTAGPLNGTMVLWEDALLLMQMCIMHLLPPPDLAGLARLQSGVHVQRVSIPRSAQPLGDLLRQLMFAILFETDGKPPRVITQSAIKKIRHLTSELEFHRAALAGEPSPTLPDPMGESVPARALTILVEQIADAVRGGGGKSEESKGAEEVLSKERLPSLKKHDQEAWQLHVLADHSQGETAAILKKKYPQESWSQPRVHDAVKRVMQWVNAGMTAEQIEAACGGGGAPARTLNPSVADMGQRQDGRAAHLRAKAQEIADSD